MRKSWDEPCLEEFNNFLFECPLPNHAFVHGKENRSGRNVSQR
jgi:hypothetical protein